MKKPTAQTNVDREKKGRGREKQIGTETKTDTERIRQHRECVYKLCNDESLNI